MSRERSISKPSRLPIIHPFAAGIDIGSRFHVAAVCPDLCDEPVQAFQAFTSILASHGSDTTTNAVALCPNCHRCCHSSIDRDNFKLHLYQKIPRLIVEAPTAD